LNETNEASKTILQARRTGEPSALLLSGLAIEPETLSGKKRRILPWLLRSLPSPPPAEAHALKREIAT
jgi:hypothetical protein